jgi:hypothetical protein
VGKHEHVSVAVHVPCPLQLLRPAHDGMQKGFTWLRASDIISPTAHSSTVHVAELAMVVKEPSAQAAHALVVDTANVPAVHVLHAVEPASDAYCGNWHAAHVICPAVAVYEPRGHCKHCCCDSNSPFRHVMIGGDDDDGDCDTDIDADCDIDGMADTDTNGDRHKRFAVSTSAPSLGRSCSWTPFMCTMPNRTSATVTRSPTVNVKFPGAKPGTAAAVKFTTSVEAGNTAPSY